MKNNAQTSRTSNSFDWAVAVFAAREASDELLLTINAVKDAAAQCPAVIDVLVNGNQRLANDISELLTRQKSLTSSSVVRVWSIVLGDKAHAWNQYVHRVWPGAKMSFFVDGYVRLNADALRLLDEGVTAHPCALGGTGTPTTGRTAENLRQQMVTEGGLHGNFFALTQATMNQLRECNVHLPLGLYRTDSTLGAALAFGLDPSRCKWDLKGRIFVHPAVTWTTDERKWWCYAEVKSQFKRTLRQAQGVLENRAVRNFMVLQKLPLQKLPRTASALVLDWAENYPTEAGAVFWKNPLSRVALTKFKQPRDWSGAAQSPQLVSVIP